MTQGYAKQNRNNSYSATLIGVVTVSNSSTEITAAEVDRKYCATINTGNRDCWINCGAAAVVGQGMFIGKQGGSFEIDQTKHNTLAVNGITKSGTTTVAFLEGTLP